MRADRTTCALLAGASLAAACVTPPRTPSTGTPAPAASASEGDDTRRAPVDRAPPRAVVFRAPAFPTIDAKPIDDAVLDTAFRGLPVDRASTANELGERLEKRDVDVLVLPYGSAFPLDAWPHIHEFLDHGGSLAVLGGAPFHEPVRSAGTGSSGWARAPRTTTFAHALLVGPAEAVARGADWAAPSAVADNGWTQPIAAGDTTWALTLRLATEKEFADEHGSAGPRDAIARPLVHVLDSQGIPRGCALLEIDHVRGAAAGGRWLFATTDAKLDAPVVRAIVERALEGASDLRGLPVHATVAPGERATVRVREQRFRPRTKKGSQAHVVVEDPSGARTIEKDVALPADVDVPTRAPGLYRVAITADGRTARTGVWARDEKLLAAGPKLSVSRDWMKKDGKTFPIVGTTYMASDVHRWFLFEPNPSVWDSDFAEMKRRGINFVRTGLWTAWSRAVDADGNVRPEILEALDAYVLTAAKHGVVVCFNLFAFLPLSFGGDDPYLDPRSLERQKRMLAQFAARYRGVSWIHWDLVNEPSYAQRKDLWSTRPIGDEHEKQAWRAWVKKKHGDDPALLRALWRDPSPDPLEVPRPEDFEQKFVQNTHRPRKVRDFQEFKEDVVAGWAAQMRDALHAAGGDPLVTLGQDEGGIYERPLQQSLAASLDYTAVHTWWKNDDLLWDGVLTKVPEKPSLHQETGLMRLEDLDGTPWRTPEAAARLLQRKIAYAFAGRGAGVVEWAWNVNPLMPIDEESTIGIVRPDGTAKPELDPMTEASAFLAKAAPLLDDFDPDPVLLVIPHARAFLGRVNAIDATRIVVRALAERFGVVPTAISDLHLTPARLAGRKLVVVPSPDVLDEAPAKMLLDASRAGTHVLVTGNVEGDSYGRKTPSLEALGLLGASRPVAMHEQTRWSATGWVLFEGQQELTRRAETPSLAALTGNVWHEPLPLELAREREPLVRLLGAALAAANVDTMRARDEEWGLAARVLTAPRAALVVVVNERPADGVRRVVVDGKTLDVPVRALASRLVLVERKTGRVLDATPGDPLH